MSEVMVVRRRRVAEADVLADRSAAPGAADPRRLGARAAFMLVVISITLGLVHAGVIVNYAYPVFACGIAFVLLYRERHLDYLEFTLWLWLVDAGVRRVTDYGSHYHTASPVIITAGLVSLVSLYRTIGWRGRAFREVRTAITTVGVVVGFGFVVGVLHSHPAGAAVDVLFYGGPLSLGAWLLLAPVDRHQILRRLSDIAIPALLILGVYGIAQFIYPPVWDVDWVTNSGLTANGTPVPFELRVFSLLDSAGPFGQTMTVLLMLAMQPLARVGWWRRIAIGVGLIALGLSLVRAAWIALAIGIIVLILCRRLAVGRLALAAGAVAVLVTIIGGPVRSAITDRFTNSVQAGSSDTSFSARVAFQAKVAPEALTNITGQGLGSTGVGTKLSGGGNVATTDLVKSFDSGIFEIIFSFGSLPGIAVLVTVIGMVVRLGRRHLRRGPPDSAYAAAALLGLTFALIFTNVMKNVYGADLWVLAAALGSPSRVRSVSSSGAARSGS